MLVAIGAAIILMIVRSLALRILLRWARKTETKIDDIIIKSLRTPSIFWSISIGLYLGLAVSDLPQKYVFYISKAIHVIVIFSITIAIANLSGRIFTNYVQKVWYTGLSRG